MFRLLLLACSALVVVAAPSTAWYDHGAVIYQIYPRSFKDSNGDGIGDLNGITEKLDHLADLGVQALWMSPIFTSPQVDYGYDISNFTDIDPDYGTLADFDRLVAKAKSLGLKVILDFVPNHSSNQHPWFLKSIKKISPYTDYYVWHDPKIVNGTRYPPNNWISNFQNGAWEWNEERQQYYLHQFAVAQPDLNYRNEVLKQEMKDVLSFWMKRGVDGFRIDAINHLFEDPLFRDEPKANVTGVPENDYEYLDHIYTKNYDEVYDVLKSWRVLMDEFSTKTNSDYKMILTEAYANHTMTIKYYDAGSTVPFNFMFISDLNNQSTAADFKTFIDRWVDSVPQGKVSNWVVGNHDNHRVASRFGTRRADQINMLAMLLPGVSVIYNGDEIGMEDRFFTYEETIDPVGCNSGPDRYTLRSRDPERTPFQWDNTTSAGFSTSNVTWLPVHTNYKCLNLQAEKQAKESHYHVFKALSALKKVPAIRHSYLKVLVLADHVLSVVRHIGSRAAVLLINFSDKPVTVNVTTSYVVAPELLVYTSSVGSGVLVGSRVNPTNVKLPGGASILYTTPNLH
ncbi:alpha-glucosidase [Megachile rotundata]|uniref:alpha-glucosidase n=1 Tax=Megachile rotundata TaxID=143995 RepID=UPI003FD62399